MGVCGLGLEFGSLGFRVWGSWLEWLEGVDEVFFQSFRSSSYERLDEGYDVGTVVFEVEPKGLEV